MAIWVIRSAVLTENWISRLPLWSSKIRVSAETSEPRSWSLEPYLLRSRFSVSLTLSDAWRSEASVRVS